MTYEMHMKDLRNEAFYEGRAEGEAKDKPEVKATEKFATVKRMLKHGKSSLAKIAEDTDLTLTTVEKIQAEMQTV